MIKDKTMELPKERQGYISRISFNLLNQQSTYFFKWTNILKIFLFVQVTSDEEAPPPLPPKKSQMREASVETVSYHSAVN